MIIKIIDDSVVKLVQHSAAVACNIVVLSGERTSLLLPIFIIQMKMEVLRLL